MKNLKIAGSLIFTFLILSTTWAQDSERREDIREKMKAQRAAFITQKLELTESEAQKFWPVFNEFDAERKALLKEEPAKISHSMSDAEAQKAIDQFFDTKSKELELHKKYVSRFKAILPAPKVAMLLTIQKEFSKEVMENMKERRSARPRDGERFRRSPGQE
jgi:hypothetical protein